jgi:hypothetical protein
LVLEELNMAAQREEAPTKNLQDLEIGKEEEDARIFENLL